MVDQISFGRRLTALAAEREGDVALIFAAGDGTDHPFSWRMLESWANQTARLLGSAGVRAGDTVVVALRNSPEHVAATLGTWKLGASVLPLRADLPAWERDRLLAIAEPAVVVAGLGRPRPW